MLGVICEDEDEDEDGDEGVDAGADTQRLAELPQCFSYFSFVRSCGKQLVCDLQGVWNADDGFVLTDPVIHYQCEILYTYARSRAGNKLPTFTYVSEGGK